MTLTDSHCHLQFERFAEDADAILQRSLEAGMMLVLPSSQLETSRSAVAIANRYERVYAGVGLHPIHVDDEAFDLEAYEALARDSKTVGIGETGLDRYRIKAETPEAKAAAFERQKALFRAQLALAEKVNKTVIMHCRDAYDEQLAVIESRGLRVPSIIHCFLGNRTQARRFLDFGCFVGFTGIITFANCAPELREVVKMVPLDRILLETDAPYLAPEPHRGKRNEPLYVEFVARQIAELKGVSYEEVVESTAVNTKNAFRIAEYV